MPGVLTNRICHLLPFLNDICFIFYYHYYYFLFFIFSYPSVFFRKCPLGCAQGIGSCQGFGSVQSRPSLKSSLGGSMDILHSHFPPTVVSQCLLLLFNYLLADRHSNQHPPPQPGTGWVRGRPSSASTPAASPTKPSPSTGFFNRQNWRRKRSPWVSIVNHRIRSDQAKGRSEQNMGCLAPAFYLSFFLLNCHPRL